MNAIFLSLLSLVHIIASPAIASDLLDQAKSDYQFQLQDYLKEEKTFSIKQGEFYKLQTFASQEEFVQSAKNLFSIRAEVWDTYFQALRIAIIENKGLNENIKNNKTKQLQDWQTSFNQHKQKIQSLQLLDEVFAESKNFEQNRLALQNTSSITLILNSIGNLQNSNNELTEFSKTLKQQINEQINNQSIKESKLRGFVEIDRSLETSRTINSDASIQVQQLSDTDSYSQRTLEDVQEKLQTSYDQIRRAYQLLSELSQGITL